MRKVESLVLALALLSRRGQKGATYRMCDCTRPPTKNTNAAHTMLLTQCAACAKPLVHDAPRLVAASER